MKRVKLVITAAFAGVLLISAMASANEGAHPLKQVKWPFQGMTGTVDRVSAQRGFQVYKEVCSGCHSMHLVSYRNLQALGFSEDEVKAIAAEYTMTDGPNDLGEMYERPGRPSDRFASPFPNEKAARASNNGAYPPDLSLIIKARPEGPNYTYSLLTGYIGEDAMPKGMKMMPGMHYNPYFPGEQIAMPPPLTNGQVEYQDGTVSTVDQMAYDVVNFLQWAAEPEMEHRKEMGLKVIFFLTVFTGLFIVAKRRIWKRIK